MTDYTEWLNSSHNSRDDEMFAGLYIELRRIARGKMAGEKAGQTLNSTGLVHEAWLRLEKSAPEEWRDRKQFYAAASEAMRRILIEAARRRLAAKRGGGCEKVPLDEHIQIAAPLPDERVVDIHEALFELEKEDEFKAKIVKMRFFGGLTYTEIAALLEVSEPTVRRHWALAKTRLYDAVHDKSS